MSFCIKCGNKVADSDAFCSVCGAPLEKASPIVNETPVVNEIPVANEAPVFSAFNAEYDKEEREFLDNTHKLLRWELKAWSIASKVLIISGIVFAAIFMLYALIGVIMAASSTFGGGILAGMGFTYSILFGSMFIALGIVNKKAAEKLPQYIDTVYTNFSLAYNRCGNVGMLVFTAILGVVSPIFFIINFVRMKANRSVIERIMKNQNVQF